VRLLDEDSSLFPHREILDPPERKEGTSSTIYYRKQVFSSRRCDPPPGSFRISLEIPSLSFRCPSFGGFPPQNRLDTNIRLSVRSPPRAISSAFSPLQNSTLPWELSFQLSPTLRGEPVETSLYLFSRCWLVLPWL